MPGLINVRGGHCCLYKGLSENQGRVAGGERQISDIHVDGGIPTGF